MKQRKSLLECFNAKVLGDHIYCAKGHKLMNLSGDGTIHIRRLERGDTLALGICQKCVDFICMGEPVLLEDKGWLNLKK